MQSVLIKPLFNAHGKEIVDFIFPILQLEFNMPTTMEARSRLLDIEMNYRQGGGAFWGAFHDSALVGTIALVATGHQAGAVQKMFVKRACRGKEMGIAQQLLNGLVEYCRKRGINRLYLGTIDTMKAACRFYERNGFIRIEQSALPSYFPVMACDNVFYQLQTAE